MLGTDLVAKAKPDGLTLGLVIATQAINPSMYKKLPYSEADFAPVTLLAEYPFIMVVTPSFPARTAQEFIALAKAKPGSITFASSGVGSGPHLGVELLKQRAGIDLLHVPYRGGAPAGMATVAGETQVVLAGASNAGLLQAGTLRGLATTGKKRSPMFPDMPSIGEFYPGYDLTIWIGLFGPPGLPEPIVPRLRDAVQSALAEPEIVQKLNVTGKLEPLILTPADFSDLIRRDYEKYRKLVADIGVKIDR